MALSNAEKQQRWRERHISRRRTVQHLASLLLRRAWSEEHIDELGQLLRSLIPSWYIADLRRALKTPTDKEMQARSEADEAATLEAWLREHPGRTRAQYKRLLRDADSEVWQWRRAMGAAINAAEQQAWQVDHPGQEYPEHECSLSDREYTDLERWRRKYRRHRQAG